MISILASKNYFFIETLIVKYSLFFQRRVIFLRFAADILAFECELELAVELDMKRIIF